MTLLHAHFNARPPSRLLRRRFAQYQRMLGSLSQCEFSMGKTLLVYDMNLKEMENYETIYADIGEGLASLQPRPIPVQRLKGRRPNPSSHISPYLQSGLGDMAGKSHRDIFSVIFRTAIFIPI